MLELADIPEEWRENAVVEPVDLDDEDKRIWQFTTAMSVIQGQPGPHGIAAILHANGELEHQYAEESLGTTRLMKMKGTKTPMLIHNGVFSLAIIRL